MMSPEAKQRIQLVLLVPVVLASVYAGRILYQRHEDKVAADKQKQKRRTWAIPIPITTSVRRNSIPTM